MARARFSRMLRTSVVAVATLAAGLGGTAVGSAEAAKVSSANGAAGAAAVPAAAAQQQKVSKKVQEPGVTASLWEWSWPSIAAECPRLHRNGYAGVQVAPPQDSVKRTALGNGSDTVLHPWWEVYQVVDYNLTSRMGSEAQFKSMVSACRKAGVKVYVDAVINHTTGQGSTSYGGQSFTPYTYPAIPYVPRDFHVKVGACPSSDGGIQDFNSKTEVWNCNLVGLEDLRTETAKVRSTLAAYLNRLLGYGVSGFRVDAAKHMPQGDLDAIYSRLHKTKDGVRPYWSLEVGPGSPGVLSPQAYTSSGDVLGLDGVKQIFNAFQSYNGSDKLGDISGLAVFGSRSGLTASSKTVSFVTNHDTNHDPGNALTYKQGAQYYLATEWLLADGYGSPQVFSSFTFGDDSNQSPPSAATGLISRASCSNGAWTCDHRRHAIVSMVKFHNYVKGSAKKHVYDDTFNVLAFSRGKKGWAAFNNNATPDYRKQSGVRTITVNTGLKKGSYCDIISGGKKGKHCTGTVVKVKAHGKATVRLPARGAVAFTKKDRL
jgi:alpha-amylase